MMTTTTTATTPAQTHFPGPGRGTASFLEQELQAGDPGLGVFNTPSLRSLHYTAPYFHDGSAPTLRDVLEMTGNTMGHTSQLLESEKDALIAYLLTL